MRIIWIVLAALVALVGRADAAEPVEAPLRVAQAGGILKVNANIEGAPVELDGQAVGRTPLVKLVPPGAYSLRIALPGYAVFEQPLTVESGKTITVDAELVRDSGSLLITTNVEGARVTVDGAVVGTTPDVLIESLKVGNHAVQVEKPGYASWTGTLEVKPGVKRKLTLTLEPNAARLVVRSEPSGAQVAVDGQVVGVTPLDYPALTAGKHSVVVYAEDSARSYYTVRAQVGETVELVSTLSRRGGGLRVRAESEDAEVYLEGAYLGAAPVKIGREIAPGRYALRVAQEGKADYSQSITVHAWRTTRIKARLGEEGDFATSNGGELGQLPVWQRWWFWALVGGAVAAGTGGAIYWSMGGEDPIPGDVIIPLP